MLVKISGLIFLLFTISCTQAEKSDSELPSAVVKNQEAQKETKKEKEVFIKRTETKKSVPVPPPKLGIIFGAAGLRSYAYIGVLKELERARIPVHAIVGLEWGALVAALYAEKASANNLEWQMLKLKEKEVFAKGIFAGSSEQATTSKLDSFFERAVATRRLADFAVKMSCPIIEKDKLKWISSGRTSRALKRCMAFPPIYLPEERLSGAAFAVEEAVQHLKAQGAEVVVFINGAAGGPLWQREERGFAKSRIIWRRLRSWYTQKGGAADEVYNIFLQSTLRSFDQRRAVISRGRSTGQALAELLTTKYNF